MGQINRLRYIVVVSVVALISLMACSSEGGTANKDSEGELLFKMKCALCHGVNGDKQLSGAKKLTESVISKDAIVAMVTNGLKQMPAFKDQLTQEEIHLVSDYAFSFREKENK